MKLLQRGFYGGGRGPVAGMFCCFWLILVAFLGGSKRPKYAVWLGEGLASFNFSQVGQNKTNLQFDVSKKEIQHSITLLYNHHHHTWLFSALMFFGLIQRSIWFQVVYITSFIGIYMISKQLLFQNNYYFNTFSILKKKHEKYRYTINNIMCLSFHVHVTYQNQTLRLI